MLTPFLPDKHNNTNFGDIVSNNFPGVLDHLDALLAGAHSGCSILSISLGKLRFCCQTWNRTAHSSSKAAEMMVLIYCQSVAGTETETLSSSELEQSCCRWCIWFLVPPELCRLFLGRKKTNTHTSGQKWSIRRQVLVHAFTIKQRPG